MTFTSCNRFSVFLFASFSVGLHLLIVFKPTDALYSVPQADVHAAWPPPALVHRGRAHWGVLLHREPLVQPGGGFSRVVEFSNAFSDVFTAYLHFLVCVIN